MHLWPDWYREEMARAQAWHDSQRASQRNADIAILQAMLNANAKPPRPDLTQRQIDWCRKHIPDFNNRSALAEGPK